MARIYLHVGRIDFLVFLRVKNAEVLIVLIVWRRISHISWGTKKKIMMTMRGTCPVVLYYISPSELFGIIGVR